MDQEVWRTNGIDRKGTVAKLCVNGKEKQRQNDKKGKLNDGNYWKSKSGKSYDKN